MTVKRGEVWLADLNPIRGSEQTLLEEAGMLLITPRHARPKGSERRKLIRQMRERIKTVFSSLWSQFIDRIFSRSWNGLWNTLKLKLLSYNLRQVGILPA
ncbi:MAG: hypothetical protein KY468_04200 [Armatimonadetes bacterium]|nr:hypothetical protein [Armatimonadota bacterium]